MYKCILLCVSVTRWLVLLCDSVTLWLIVRRSPQRHRGTERDRPQRHRGTEVVMYRCILLCVSVPRWLVFHCDSVTLWLLSGVRRGTEVLMYKMHSSLCLRASVACIPQ